MLVFMFLVGILLFIVGLVGIVNNKNLGWFMCLISILIVFTSLYWQLTYIKEVEPLIYEEDGVTVWSAEIGEFRCHYNEKDYLVCEV